jgi:hypothetical protein
MTKTSMGIQELRKRIGEKAKAERSWSKWSAAEVDRSWGLYAGYRDLWRSVPNDEVS